MENNKQEKSKLLKIVKESADSMTDFLEYAFVVTSLVAFLGTLGSYNKKQEYYHESESPIFREVYYRNKTNEQERIIKLSSGQRVFIYSEQPDKTYKRIKLQKPNRILDRRRVAKVD